MGKAPTNIGKLERAEITEGYKGNLKLAQATFSLAVDPRPARTQAIKLRQRARALEKEAEELEARIELAREQRHVSEIKVAEYMVILSRLPRIRTRNQLHALRRTAKRLARRHIREKYGHAGID